MDLRRFLAACTLALAVPAGLARADAPLQLIIDADFSVARAGAEAIELGIRSALSEVEYRAGDVDLEVVRMDHRGNAKRSVSHLKKATTDANVLAVFGGVHSPPYISGQSVVNEGRLPLLLPWSAAGPITRAPEGQENWIFRLSVDDWQAAPFLAEQVISAPECTRSGLVLLDSGWGRSNRVALLSAFEDKGADEPVVIMFPASAGQATYGEIAEKLVAEDVDCAVLLSFAPQGAGIVNELHARGHIVRFFSHWGVLSGPVADLAPFEAREAMQFRVLQTCGLRSEANAPDAARRALESAAVLGASYSRLAEVPATTGFVHGYDLTRLFIAALEQAAASPDWVSASVFEKRQMLHLALERLEAPVEGILRTYEAPFSAYAQEAPDAHEALRRSDLCLASFGRDGALTLALGN
ncbi:MAG: ABC transporter substrate-binding protein [Pseudomonadota bacterium]